MHFRGYLTQSTKFFPSLASGFKIREVGLFTISMYQEMWQMTSHLTSQSPVSLKSYFCLWANSLELQEHTFLKTLTLYVPRNTAKTVFRLPSQLHSTCKAGVFSFVRICQLYSGTLSTYSKWLDIIFFNQLNIFMKKDIHVIILEIQPQIEVPILTLEN